ncbi:MAG: VOC family protein [Candidatus Cybelea sp.]
MQTIYPSVRYNDGKAAIAWLKSVLGFEEREVYAGDGDTIAHAQLQLAGNLIMLGSVKNDPYGTNPKNLGGVTEGIYIALSDADIDTSYARAKAAGAEIIRELEDTEYGSHEFGVRDPEGHIWSFGTYRPQALQTFSAQSVS